MCLALLSARITRYFKSYTGRISRPLMMNFRILLRMGKVGSFVKAGKVPFRKTMDVY